MNPTSKAFQKELDNVVSKASVDDVSSLRKIKIEGETDEATSSGSAGQFSAPLFSLFSDEAPKKKKVKGGVVETDESIEEEDKLEMIFELLDDFTSGGKLYYDEEEDSIGMINPETKEWIFEFEKSGNLYYSYRIFVNIFKWISMKYPDFEPYITKWVERILQNEVKNTQVITVRTFQVVERILQSGNELNPDENINESVDINNEEDLEMIFELLDDFTSEGKLYYDDEEDSIWMINPNVKQWIFQFKKSGKLWYSYPIFTNIFKYISMEYPDFVPYITKWVERILQNEVKDTNHILGRHRNGVERILQKEVKDTRLMFRQEEALVERILQSGNELNPDENINESIIDSEEDKLEMIFELLDDFTSNGKLYYDNEAESIWMINPETKQWIFEFEKSGDLYYSYPIFVNIFKWISMEYPDFVPYITKWVERILQNEVKNTAECVHYDDLRVERILQNEVKNTTMLQFQKRLGVERILQNEVKNTRLSIARAVLRVERILQNEVKNTSPAGPGQFYSVERILQSGNELNPNENINESIIDSEEDKLEMIFELLDDFTSGGKLYYDNEYDSIWMINPKTKQWIFEFKKSGTLWYYSWVFTNIFKYISMEYPDFNPYIAKWVERILQTEVKNTFLRGEHLKPFVERILQTEVKNTLATGIVLRPHVERILQTEVKNTIERTMYISQRVERILQKGTELNSNENINESVDMNNEEDLEVIFELLDDFTSNAKLYYDDETESIWMINPNVKQWIFQFKKSGKLWYYYPTFVDIFKWISLEYPDFNPYITKWVERILQKEVKYTFRRYPDRNVERILQKEVKDTQPDFLLGKHIVERILQKGDELLIGGKSDKMSLEDISKKHNIKIGQLKKQFNMGLKIEKEHTNNEEVAKEITLDHLYEDPEYYTKLNKMEKGEFKEATGAASAGQYSGPSFLAKSQSKKDWRGAAKPLYKGGKFVRVKKKCKTFPYCNQGDIKALDLWEDDKLTETIKKIAKNKRVHENVIRAIILHEIEEKLFGD